MGGRPPDPEKHVLGPLCKRGHRWEGGEQSVRYHSTHQCVECMDERRATYGHVYYDEHVEERREAARAWYHAHRDERVPAMAEYRKTPNFRASARKYRKRNRERLLERTRQWKAQNRDHLHASWRAWAQTPYGRARAIVLHRKRQERLKEVPGEPYTAAELAAHFERFGNACAYCGVSGAFVVDHVIAVSRRGPDALWNVVPACAPCNQSKYNHEVERWLIGGSRSSRRFGCRRFWHREANAPSSRSSPPTTHFERGVVGGLAATRLHETGHRVERSRTSNGDGRPDREREAVYGGRVLCNLQGHTGAVQLAVTRSRAVAAEVSAVSADAEPTSATQVLMLFLRHYSSGPARDAMMALIFPAALGVELGVEPDDEARRNAAATAMQAKGRTR